ncbi:hypothetical protein P9112_006197 [Eukaryota sp. TZLM1-RC]
MDGCGIHRHRGIKEGLKLSGVDSLILKVDVRRGDVGEREKQGLIGGTARKKISRPYRNQNLYRSKRIIQSKNTRVQPATLKQPQQEYSNIRRSEDQMINQFKRIFGFSSDVVIRFGDSRVAAYKIKSWAPTIKEKLLRKLFK